VAIPPAVACDIGAYQAVAPTVTTGDVSGLARTAATLTGTVAANGPSASVRFQYGKTTGYGSATATQTLVLGVLWPCERSTRPNGRPRPVLSGRMARPPRVAGWDPFADLAVPARPRRERAQSVAEAGRLRQEGLLLREIGVELGVSAKTVHAWLSDPEGSKARERKRRYRAVCVDCGGPCYWQGPYVERGAVRPASAPTGTSTASGPSARSGRRRSLAGLMISVDCRRPRRPACPARGFPYRAIQREFGSFSRALKAAQTRRTYTSKVRQYLAWLAGADLDEDPLMSAAPEPTIGQLVEMARKVRADAER
jgi:hypothetical protein